MAQQSWKNLAIFVRGHGWFFQTWSHITLKLPMWDDNLCYSLYLQAFKYPYFSISLADGTIPHYTTGGGFVVYQEALTFEEQRFTIKCTFLLCVFLQCLKCAVSLGDNEGESILMLAKWVVDHMAREELSSSLVTGYTNMIRSTMKLHHCIQNTLQWSLQLVWVNIVLLYVMIQQICKGM